MSHTESPGQNEKPSVNSCRNVKECWPLAKDKSGKRNVYVAKGPEKFTSEELLDKLNFEHEIKSGDRLYTILEKQIKATGVSLNSSADAEAVIRKLTEKTTMSKFHPDLIFAGEKITFKDGVFTITKNGGRGIRVTIDINEAPALLPLVGFESMDEYKGVKEALPREKADAAKVEDYKKRREPIVFSSRFYRDLLTDFEKKLGVKLTDKAAKDYVDLDEELPKNPEYKDELETAEKKLKAAMDEYSALGSIIYKNSLERFGKMLSELKKKKNVTGPYSLEDSKMVFHRHQSAYEVSYPGKLAKILVKTKDLDDKELIANQKACAELLMDEVSLKELYDKSKQEEPQEVK